MKHKKKSVILSLPNLPVHIFFHYSIDFWRKSNYQDIRTLSFHESQENTKIQANEPSP